MDFFDIYTPLLPGELPDYVRYVVVLGGRGSAKSFHTSTAIGEHSGQDSLTTLYTRFTMTSANISIIPEFTEKLDLLGGQYNVKASEIVNLRSGGKVLFRGIMQSGKNQTARLKSIPNVKLFVLDEGEEMVDENSFDVIDLSLRKLGVHAMLWIVLNPSDITHWIYRRFFAKVMHRLKPNEARVIGDTCYIWTTYEINPFLDGGFLARAEKMAAQDPEKYKHIFLGYWQTKKEGLIYPRWERITEAEIPLGLPMWYGLDWGYGGDPAALVALRYDPAAGILYARQVAYATQLLVPAIAQLIIEDGKRHGMQPEDCVVYCDPARPENKDLLRVGYGINAFSADNRDKAGRIGYLQGFRVRYAGDDIHAERTTYSWKPNPQDRSTYSAVPQDGGDHAMDAIVYGVQHLRRMGVMAQ